MHVKHFLLLGLFLLGYSLKAQDEVSNKDGVDVHHVPLNPKEDSLNLKNTILNAHWHAHIRSFLMSTTNEGDLKDRIINLVDQIIELKKQSPNTDTSILETQIDQLVYQLYELTSEEIKIVTGE